MNWVKNTAAGIAVVAVFLAFSYMEERPKYQFEEMAKRFGQQVPGARLILSAKSGDITSPAFWFWPATTTFNYAVPAPADGRFYVIALVYEMREPIVSLVDADCTARDVSLYDLNEPESASPALNFLGDPIKAPNGETYRLFKYHYAAPPEWIRAFCDSNWTAERKAVAQSQTSR